MISFFRKKQPEQERPNLFQTMNALSESLEAKLVLGDIKLPVLPIVASRVIGLAASRNTNLEDLSSLIHQDQALAGHVLRIANSALFASSQPIESLHEAVSRLGTSMVSELAAIVSVRGEVFQSTAFKADLDAVWRHALIAGMYGKQIATQLDRNAETQFMCGLLHSVGKPILYQMIAESGFLETIPVNRYYAFSDLIKRLHPLAGKLAASHWKLPAPVQSSCAYYTARKETIEHPEEVNITYLSARLASWSVAEENSEAMTEAVQRNSVVKELGLDDATMEFLMNEKDDIVKLADSITKA